jgi:hypothetical protein
VLKVPIALFRCGSQWCVLVLDDGARVRRREVQIAHRNASDAEILAGLALHGYPLTFHTHFPMVPWEASEPSPAAYPDVPQMAYG